MIAVGRIIEGFPYAERFCPYCDHHLDLIAALHVQGQEEVYKALFYCKNLKCEVYDEAAKKLYARVYYSNENAYQLLEGIRIWMPKRKVR